MSDYIDAMVTQYIKTATQFQRGVQVAEEATLQIRQDCESFVESISDYIKQEDYPDASDMGHLFYLNRNRTQFGFDTRKGLGLPGQHMANLARRFSRSRLDRGGDGVYRLTVEDRTCPSCKSDFGAGCARCRPDAVLGE